MSDSEVKIGAQQGVLVAEMPTSTESEVRAAVVEAKLIVRHANAGVDVEFDSLSKSAINRKSIGVSSKRIKRHCEPVEA